MEQIHPATTEHLPAFITSLGQTDILFIVTVVLLISVVLAVGNLRLDAQPA